nr:cytochrome b6/f complex subunit VIII [Ulnaria ulna]WGN98731.1 cytochrome b6/f complex subunit VIII [Ulnaria ulna]
MYGYYKSRLGWFNDDVYIFISTSSMGSKWFLIL